MALDDGDPRPRPAWFESWRVEVYEYRQAELQRDLKMVMATMERLNTIVTKAENVTATAERWNAAFWAKIGIVGALTSPVIAVLVGHFWR